MLVDKLAIKTTSTMQNNEEILVLLLIPEVESRVEIRQDENVNFTGRILVMDVTLVHLRDVYRVDFKMTTIKRIWSVSHIHWSKRYKIPFFQSYFSLAGLT